MNKRTLFIVGGIAAVLMLCACVAVAGIFLYNAGKAAETITTELEKVEVLGTEVVQATAVAEATAVPPTEAPVPTKPAVPTAAVDPAGGTAADETANIFLRYLGSQQYEDAVSITSSDLRDDVETPDLMREIVEDKGLQPQSWEWTDTKVNEEKQETYLNGTMTFADGRQGTVEVQLAKENETWLVFYMDLQADGASDEPLLNQQDLAQISADVFIDFWKEGDYAAAFEMGAKAFKEQVGSPEKLEEILGGTGLQVEDWTWDAYDSFEMKDTGWQVIEWNGTAQFQNSLKGPVKVQLVEENGSWMVLFFDVKTE